MSLISEILEEGGISLESVGVKNWALSKEYALKVLEKFHELKIPIFGGDVCEIINGIIEYNYDNWYCEKEANESQFDFANRSIILARDYILSYNSDEPDKILFVFVPDKC